MALRRLPLPSSSSTACALSSRLCAACRDRADDCLWLRLDRCTKMTQSKVMRCVCDEVDAVPLDGHTHHMQLSRVMLAHTALTAPHDITTLQCRSTLCRKLS